MAKSCLRMRVLLLLTLLLFIGCQTQSERRDTPSAYIPSDARALLVIHDMEQFRSEFRNNTLLESFVDQGQNSEMLGILEEILPLDLEDGSLVVFLPPDSTLASRRNYVLLVPDAPDEIRDSISAANPPAEEFPWQLEDSTKLQVARQNGIVLVSPSSRTTERTLTGSGSPSPALIRALHTANKRTAATLLLPAEGEHPLARFLLKPLPDTPTNDSVTWSAFDLQLRSDALMLQGIEIRPDSLWDTRKVLRGTPVLPLQESLTLMPADAQSIFSYSLQDPRRFLNNQQTMLARSNPHTELIESVEHLSILETETSQLLILNCLNTEDFTEAFRPYRTDVPPFQGREIYRLEDNTILGQTFSPLLDRLPAMRYYALMDPFLVFAEDLEDLQDLISSYTLGDTFARTERFEKLRSFMASESSALAIALDPERSPYLSDSTAILGLPKGIRNALPERYLYTGQLNSSEAYDLLEYQFRQEGDPSGSGASVTELFSRKLEGQVASGPFFLKNHNTGRLDIAVQDDRNQLYLFSDRGELFWKKELKGPIQGKISQVDLYKNGKWQMAFTTPDALSILDRNGKEVSPFPRKFPGGNLGPLAVFDYEGNKNYRLVFGQGSKVHMLDGQGRNVRGFKFTDAGSAVLGAPQHMRIGTRDYLLFRLEDGRLRILNRVGDTRIRVTDRFDFSGNGIFLYRNTFAFTDTQGNLVTINTRGKVGRNKLNLNPDHGMFATAKTLALMNDNQLRVKGKSTELELGVYTRPLIFYLYDIIYVAVTDIQSQRLYLFRSDASTVKGFPVEANGLPDMADTDGDRNPELVTKYRDSSIVLYRLQR